MRGVLVLVAFAVWPASGSALRLKRTDPLEPSCSILEYGPYRPLSPHRHYKDPAAVTGQSFEIDHIEFMQQTSIIIASLGTGFGIRYQSRNVPENARVTWRVTYPRGGVRGHARWERTDRVAGGDDVRHIVYDFEHTWEMVTGRWRFDVLIDGHVACGRDFTVK